MSTNPFQIYSNKPITVDGIYSQAEVGLANRNNGNLLETLTLDITPTGCHYLLTHFDVPLLDPKAYKLEFSGSFETPFEMLDGRNYDFACDRQYP